jgi:hypothetical protein
MAQYIELGLDTFGDIQAGLNGELLSHAQVIRNVIDESVLADEVGVYCIGLGEHHRADFAISSPQVLLGAIASRTRRIHLASSVTVLSSDDPIRVFQRFSTVNALSSGRAEVILGRGSFTDRFHCSATAYRTTKRCLTTNSICLRHFRKESRSRGEGKRAYFHRSKAIRSKPGLVWAAVRKPWFVQHITICR